MELEARNWRVPNHPREPEFVRNWRNRIASIREATDDARDGKWFRAVQKIYKDLARGVQIHPHDGIKNRGDTEEVWNLDDWFFFYWRPSPAPPLGGIAGGTEADVPPAPAAVVEARSRQSNDSFAEREGMRITAILASWKIDELRGREPDGEDAEWRLDEARFLVYQWLREVMRAGDEGYDSYFVAFRRKRDKRTHPYTRGCEDPFVHEIVLMLFDFETVQAGKDAKLRPILRQHFREHFDEMMPNVMRWLVRRYEFGWAEEIRKGGPVRQPRVAGYFLPRLGAATFLGAFAVTTQTSVWGVMKWLGGHPGYLILYVLLVGSVVWIILRRNVLRREPLRNAPQGYRGSMVRIFKYGVGYSLASAAVTTAFSYFYDLLGSEPCAPEYPGVEMLLVVLAVGVTALLLGYLLQLFWEDKPISEEV